MRPRRCIARNSTNGCRRINDSLSIGGWGGALSSGEGYFAGGQGAFSGPSPVKKSSPEKEISASGYLRSERLRRKSDSVLFAISDGAGFIGDASRAVARALTQQKQAKTPRNKFLGVFAYSFIWICSPRGPTLVEKTICVLVSPKRCKSVMNSSNSIVLEK